MLMCNSITWLTYVNLISVKRHILTVNAPVVYMAQDVMILMRTNQFPGPLEGVDPENLGFSGPWNGNERVPFGPKKD